MRPLRAPFVLLATTFVTTVLATHINVPIRRDFTNNNVSVTDQNNFVIETNVLVQNLNCDVQNISSTTNESDIQKFLIDLASVETNVNAYTFFMGSFEPLNGSVAIQALVNNTISLFLNLKDTAGSLTQQANATVRFGPFQFTNVVALVTELASRIHVFDLLLSTAFTPDVLERVQPVSSAVDSVFNNTMNVFQSLLQGVKENTSVEDLPHAFNETNAAVQKLGSDIQQDFFSTKPQEFSLDFSQAAGKVFAMNFLMDMVIPIDQATSQNLLNTSILPFYRTLNDTAHRLTRQPNVTADLPQIGFNLYLASLTDMREGFGAVNGALERGLTPDPIKNEEFSALSNDILDNVQ